MIKLLLCMLVAVILCSCANPAGTSHADGTQNTAVTVSPTDTTVAMYDPFREWYLSEADREMFPAEYPVQVDGAHQGWVVKTPGQSTVSIGDIVFTVDFFKETYHFGEGLQVRVTALNTGTEAFTYVQKGLHCHVICEETGKVIDHTVFRKEHQIYYQDDVQYKTIAPNESVEYEYFFLIDSPGFGQAGKYTFSCATIDNRTGTTDHLIQIPFEVIAN